MKEMKKIIDKHKEKITLLLYIIITMLIFLYIALAGQYYTNYQMIKLYSETVTTPVIQVVETNNVEKINTNQNTQMIEFNQTDRPYEDEIVAVMKTTNGTFKIRLFRELAPNTVNNFIGLAADKYYDGVIFHRVINNFMIQGGDPTGTGMGGSSIYGDKFEDEFSDSLSNIKGSIAMANSGKNTNGSQFFINQADNTFLDPKHSVFGHVYEGTENIDKIAKTKTEENNKPVKEIKIISLEVMIVKGGKLIPYEVKKEEFIKEYNKNKQAKKEASKNRAVKSGDIIAVHYTGTLEDGTVFDSSKNPGRTALEFEVGSGNMIPGFDAGVVGMKIGDKKILKLVPKDAYGEYNPNNKQTVPLSDEDKKGLEKGGVKLAVGEILPTMYGNFKIIELTEDSVTIDVNHELAGKSLIFDVELIEFKN